MDNPRRYGDPPYGVVVVHGGPGAPGEMAPVARKLALSRGVLEPLQTRASLAGQVEELGNLLEDTGEQPFVLIGYSWGAILSFIFAAQNPAWVSKLILVSSGVFSNAYVETIKRNRLSRLSAGERARMDELLEVLGDPSTADKDTPFAELGDLIARADAYDPLPHQNDATAFQHDIFEAVWRDAEELRAGGRLLEMGRDIACPVVAIHGDFDPHPWEGIKKPLEEVLHDFRFVLLEKCGHHPWYEKHAREDFFKALEEEVGR
ncbi:MAG: alpha/beta hydrolase [Actinomycetota bacterium]|nr:alpha/beta hydrolase [Actinomycetota bacterium]MDD5667232.1 alpha/beta hydrolase [Actinomycetota bacterium]